MPAKVIATEPNTCTPTSATAQPIRPSCSKATISAENVEKVVNPAQNPVTTSKRHCGDSADNQAKKASAAPMT
jgi:hypothetical protein